MRLLRGKLAIILTGENEEKWAFSTKEIGSGTHESEMIQHTQNWKEKSLIPTQHFSSGKIDERCHFQSHHWVYSNTGTRISLSRSSVPNLYPIRLLPLLVERTHEASVFVYVCVCWHACVMYRLKSSKYHCQSHRHVCGGSRGCE